LGYKETINDHADRNKRKGQSRARNGRERTQPKQNRKCSFHLTGRPYSGLCYTLNEKVDAVMFT
jgi:hypothetical protein